MASYMGHEYTPAPAEQVQGRYRVGDRVRVVKDGWPKSGDGSWHCADIGTIETVIGFDRDGWGLDRVEGEEWFYLPTEISPAFRPGDRVKLNKHSGVRACGERGTVSAVIGDNVSVRMDDASLYGTVVAFFHADDLDWERVEERAADCAGRKEEREQTLGDILATALAKRNEPKPKFKAGDVVRCLKNADGQFTKGKLYTIRGEQRGYSVGVERDDRGGTQNGWSPEFFELVTAAPCPQDNEQTRNVYVNQFTVATPQQPAIVALINKNGQPRPSTYPHVHASVADATKEAERLARNNPGQEFAVYQRVAGRVAEVEYNMREVA